MQLDDLGKWLQQNNYLPAAANFRWQLLLQRQIKCQPGQSNDGLQDFWQQAEGADLKLLDQETGSILLKTPGFVSKKAVLDRLKLTTLLVLKNLGKNYYLDPFSQAVSADQGIKIRWQLPEFLLQQSYSAKFKALKIDYLTYRSQIYLKIIQQLNQYHWVLLYLTGAAKQASGKLQKSSYWVKRQGQPAPQNLDFTANDFKNPNWSYLPFKPFKVTVRINSAVKEVIGGIEFQGLELDPFSAVGLSADVLTWLQLATVYFWVSPGIDNDRLTAVLQQALQKSQATAAANPFAAIIELKAALVFLDNLANYVKSAKLNDTFLTMIDKWRALFQAGEQTKSGRLARMTVTPEKRTWYLAQQALGQLQTSWQTEELIDHNSLEVLSAAVAAGKNYQIISKKMHLIKVEDQLIGDGFLLDSTGNLAQKIWQDRLLAGQLVSAAGYQIPFQWTVKNRTDFEKKYPAFAELALAIKGRYQPGTFVFRLPPQKAKLWQVVKQILQTDSECLIQQAQLGSCYRILLVDQTPITILERLPQQIVGDGHSTIAQLIKRKQLQFTQQQRKFEFGELQRQALAAQGRTLNDVLPRGIQLLLRFDASTQSGEEYLEVSDQLDPSYLPVIKNVAAALKLRNGVLDVIIGNLYQRFDPQKAAGQFYFLSAHQQADLSLLQQVKLGEPKPLGKLILQHLLAEK